MHRLYAAAASWLYCTTSSFNSNKSTAWLCYVAVLLHHHRRNSTSRLTSNLEVEMNIITKILAWIFAFWVVSCGYIEVE